MNFEFSSFLTVLPEIFLFSMTCLILLIDLFVSKSFSSRLSYVWVQSVLIIVTILTVLQFHQPEVVVFNGTYVLDPLAVVLKSFIYICSFVAFVYARNCLPKINVHPTAYYILGLFAVLGMMVIVSGRNFITLFLGLELFSLPIYAMIGLERNSSQAIEAAVKYFIIGSLASGILLYGLSMLYGVTKSLDVVQISNTILQSSGQYDLMLWFGLVFVVVGLAFKLGTVPFHMWVPDVYEGASTPVVLFLGSAPKIAGLALVFRLLVDGLEGLSAHWHTMLVIIAILSMLVGNLAAIVQKNIKRMLAYSSIAHMGYMSLGLLTTTSQGYGAALFYMVTYALMTLVAFGLLAIMNYAGYEANRIEDLRGLNSRNPWLALMMLFAMFSLAGVPPIVGFMAKVAVIEALIEVHLVWLAALALLFAIIGAYYYIRVVKVMYFDNPVEQTPIHCSQDMQVMLSINGCLLLALGIVPGYLFSLCQHVF